MINHQIKHKMKIIILNILLLTGLSTFAQQHTQHGLTLKRSKEAALAYSKSIQNGELNLSSSQADVKAAKAAYLPSVSITGVGIYGFKDIISAFPPYLNQGINNFYFAGASATEAIYAGGKIKTSNQLAALQVEVNKIKAKQSIDSVLLVTEQKYWNLVNLQEQHKTIAANEKLLDEVLKQQNDLLASGLIARNDMLKVKVQRSKLLLNKSKLNNGTKIALLDFCLYTGLPFDSLLVMQDTLNINKVPSLENFQPDVSLTQNDNFHLLKKGVDAEKLQTKLTRGDYLPSVSVGVNAGAAGVVGRGVGSTFMPLSFGVVSIPISDWWGKGKQKLKQREISEKIASNRLEDGQNKLKVAIMQGWYSVVDAQKEISFAKENLQLAQENMKVSQDNYSSGLAGVSELMDAQAALQEAESDHVNAYAGFNSKMASYQYLIGEVKR